LLKLIPFAGIIKVETAVSPDEQGDPNEFMADKTTGSSPSTSI